jgi:hypothetical protein
MQRLAVAVASLVMSLVVGSGCRQDNPESCELPANAGIGGCPPVDATDAPQEAAPECTMSSPCTANPDKGVCDTALNGGTCVQCTAAIQTACKGASLACINDTCAPCTKHSDCVDSNVCMPGGTCANADDVAYLDGGGTDQMTCSQVTKCTRIDKAVMAKNILKISGTLTDRATLNDVKNIVILADPNARLTPTQDGAALDIRGNSTIQIYDLEISHMSGGAAKDGIALSDDAELALTNVRLINNTADGARIAGGHLTFTHCTIAQNVNRGISMTDGELTISRSEIKANAGGGVFIPGDGKFQIVGNFIFGNGGTGSQAGGINVPASSGDSTNRVDFNSISHNNATGGISPGINCVSSTALTAKYNVVWKNGVSPTFLTDQINTAGCAHISSDIGPLPALPGASNFNVDPGFADEANGDLHLKPDSPARKLAQPLAADVSGLAANDFDGDSRMSVIMVDLGADQTPP